MKPSLAKGTRDFTAQEVVRRRYIINILQKNFELFGFQPLETPSFENLSTLTGKYGEEGDRLIFKILESGDYFSDIKNDLKDLSILDGQTDIIFKLTRNAVSQGKSYNDLMLEIDNNQNLELEIKRYFKNSLGPESYFNYDSLRKNSDSIYFEEAIRKAINFEFLDNKIGKTNSKELTPKISDKALRYDLTVPFARFVAMNQGQLTFPFKRYQIQPVWRADRPQKGRFREFYQCDADVVGSESLWQEVDLVQLYFKSFKELGVSVTIHLNNRKILSGLAEYAGISDKLIDFTVALDKLDKIGKDGVVKEMKEKGIEDSSIEKLDFLFSQGADALENLLQLKEKFQGNEIGLQGVNELEFVLTKCLDLGIDSSNLLFDITLARGLDYYTGAIFEVKADEAQMGSIGGGGRYDNLTEVFGVKNIPGIGISFGLDRIYLVMEELKLFPENADQKVEYLFANYGENEAVEAMKVIAKLRINNISAEMYPEAAKLKKQFTYAEKKEIPNLVFLGEEEIKNGTITVKNLLSGEQKTMTQEDFLNS